MERHLEQFGGWGNIFVDDVTRHAGDNKIQWAAFWRLFKKAVTDEFTSAMKRVKIPPEIDASAVRKAGMRLNFGERYIHCPTGNINADVWVSGSKYYSANHRDQNKLLGVRLTLNLGIHNKTRKNIMFERKPGKAVTWEVSAAAIGANWGAELVEIFVRQLNHAANTVKAISFMKKQVLALFDGPMSGQREIAVESNKVAGNIAGIDVEITGGAFETQTEGDHPNYSTITFHWRKGLMLDKEGVLSFVQWLRENHRHFRS